MTQGFDEFYDCLELQCLNTQEVGELCFEAGAASRQAEIDSLRIKLDGANERAAMTLNHKNRMVDKMQAEIDELQKRLAMYERQDYKLVPVDATDAQWEAAINAYSIAMDGKDILPASAFYDIYEAMIGAVE